CIEVAREDSVLSKTVDQLVGIRGLQTARQANQFALKPLFRLLRKTPFFNDGDFETAYGEVESAWYAETVKMAVVAPVIDFESDGELQLIEGIRIVPFSFSELPLNPLPITHFDHVRHALRGDFEVPLVVGQQSSSDSAKRWNANDTITLMERMVVSLYLFQAGDFRCPGFVSYATNIDTGIQFSIRPIGYQLPNRRYALKSQRRMELADFIKK